MPSTVAQLLAAAGLEPEGRVPWGTPLPQRAPGVYVVALTEDPHGAAGSLSATPVSDACAEALLAVRPELRLDGSRPDAARVADRLRRFWLADETVVYIGLASSLRSRVQAFYRTPLGAKRPHAGGWWLKTLDVLNALWVHYAATPDFRAAEKLMLQAFADAVPPEERSSLHDSERVAPFANLRVANDLIKRHRITGATGDLPAGRAAFSAAGRGALTWRCSKGH